MNHDLEAVHEAIGQAADRLFNEKRALARYEERSGLGRTLNAVNVKLRTAIMRRDAQRAELEELLGMADRLVTADTGTRTAIAADAKRILRRLLAASTIAATLALAACGGDSPTTFTADYVERGVAPQLDRRPACVKTAENRFRCSGLSGGYRVVFDVACDPERPAGRRCIPAPGQ